MALDLGPGVASEARSGRTAARSSAPDGVRATQRVIAVLHARSAEHLVPALAGATGQTVRPDLLIAVNSVHSWARAGGTAQPDTAPPTAATQAHQPAADDADGAQTGQDLSTLTSELFAVDGPPEAAAIDPDSTAAMAAVEFDELRDTPVPRTPPSVYEVLTAQCDAVLPLPSADLNRAVQAALRWVDSETEPPDDATPRQDWIWLLDDHDRADSHALDRLLDQVRISTTVTVVGAKHRGGADGRELLDVGLTTTRHGRVMSFVDPGEPDQGQRDHVRDTLAVGLPGLLIRRDVWTALRGLDPALQGCSDTDAAIDLCRRAWLAGGRVEVAPAAVVTSLRDGDPGVSRRARTHRRLAGAALPAVPLMAISVLLGAVLRLLAGIAAKEPIRATRHAGHSLVPLLRPDQLVRSRWRAWRSRSIARRRLRPLLASTGQTLRWHRDRLQRSLPRLVSPAGMGTARVWPAIVASLALLAAGGFALARILPGGPFHSAAWPGIGDGLAETAQAWWSSWIPAGLGSPGPADPLLASLTLLGAPFGSPQTGVRLLLIAGPALAALSAWWAAGALTRRGGVRIAAALGWAASPVALLAVSQARVWLVLTLVALPVAVRAIGQAIAAHTSRSSWAWSAAAGLALVPASTGPAALTLTVTAVTVLAAIRSRRPTVLFATVPALVMAGPTLLAARSAPALLIAEPAALVHRAAPPGWQGLLGWAEPPAAALGSQLATLRGWLEPLIGGHAAQLTTTIAPLVLGGLPVVMALGALRVSLRGSPRGAVCRTGWLIAAIGVLAVYLAPRVIVGVDAAGPVRGSAAAGTVLTLLGLCIAGVSGWGARRPARAGFWVGAGRAGLAVVCVLAMLPALVSVLAWSVQENLAPSAQSVRSGGNPPLPAVVVDAATSSDQVRVATVRVLDCSAASSCGGQPTLQVGLVRDEGASALRAAAASTVRTGPDADAADQHLAAALAQVTSGAGDARTILAPFGVGAIVLLPGQGSGSATDTLAEDLDSTLGLAPVGSVEGARAWRVDSVTGSATAPDRPAAVRLVPTRTGDNPSTGGQTTGDGDTDSGNPPSPAWFAIPSRNGQVDADVRVEAGTLQLGERFDAGWQASLDGKRLTPVRVDGWGQGFEVPAGSGRLIVRHAGPWQDVIGWTQLAVLALALLIALPVRSRDERRLRADGAASAATTAGTLR